MRRNGNVLISFEFSKKLIWGGGGGVLGYKSIYGVENLEGDAIAYMAIAAYKRKEKKRAFHMQLVIFRFYI